jgi:hypothetical protein
MATWQAQVQALTKITISSSGTNPIESELTQFLTDGAREVFGMLPPKMKENCIKSTTLDDDPTSLDDMDTIGEVVSVSREHADSSGVFHPCRKVPVWAHSRVEDSTDLMYATVTDPAYYIYNNSLKVFPTTTANQTAYVHYYGHPTTTYSATGIDEFPNEAEYLVGLYAAIKSLQSALSANNANTDINNALSAITAELADADDLCDSIVSKTNLAATEVGLAKAEAAEMDTYTDTTSSNFETACDAIATAIGKITSYNWSGQFSDANAQLTRVKDALDNAEKIIDDGGTVSGGASTHDAISLLTTDEDIDMVSSVLTIAETELKRAQTHIAEWKTIADVAATQASAFGGEVQARGAFIDAKAKTVQSYIGAAQGYIAAAQGYASAIQSKLSAVQGHVLEAKTRMERDAQQYKWYQEQQMKLQSDYDKGLQMLLTGGMAQAPLQGEGQKR